MLVKSRCAFDVDPRLLGGQRGVPGQTGQFWPARLGSPALGHGPWCDALLGLDGVRVLEVSETPDEGCVTVEMTSDVVRCAGCGCRALAKDRKCAHRLDLPRFGVQPASSRSSVAGAVPIPDCAKTWTEGSPHVPAQALLTVRAGAEATRQVGELDLPVPVVSKSSGCAGGRSLDAVVRYGTACRRPRARRPLLRDKKRVSRLPARRTTRATWTKTAGTTILLAARRHPHSRLGHTKEQPNRLRTHQQR